MTPSASLLKDETINGVRRFTISGGWFPTSGEFDIVIEGQIHHVTIEKENLVGHEEIYEGRVARDKRNYNSDTSNYRETAKPIMTHDELLARLSCVCCGNSEEAALRAVVELHKPYIDSVGDERFCNHCESEGMTADYPCKTIWAIEGELK